ncbi:MAG: alpha/beta fold hydrolase [Pseudomonadota bacterium]
MKTIAISLGLTLLVPACIALGLILSQWPKPMAGQGGLDFEAVTGMDLSQVPQTQPVPMRDGYALQVRRYGTRGPLVVLVHGSGWHGLQFHDLAQALAPQARVVVPDLRGHGFAPGRRGDVAYIGQLEDDLADLIASEAQGDPVVMVGHSSGGGLVIRMAGGAHGDLIDRAVLLAPYVQHDAPVTQPNSGGWAYALTRRIIGLAMLNAAGVRALNGTTAVQFDMPRTVLEGPLGDSATVAYSWRLQQSFAPRRDWAADIAALPPFTLVAGTQDRAFDAAGYAPMMEDITSAGRYVVLQGVGHLAVVDAPGSLAEIKRVLDDL